MKSTHVSNLEQEMLWLKECIDQRLEVLRGDKEIEHIVLPEPPTLINEDCHYADFVLKSKLSPQERIVIILSLVNHLNPGFLDFMLDEEANAMAFKLHVANNGFSIIPTAETAMYIIAGFDLDVRIQHASLFSTEHPFYKQSVFNLGEADKGLSEYTGILALNNSFRDLFVENKYTRPRFSSDFPAHLITTELGWNDMLLMPSTKAKLDETKAYLDHYKTMANDWSMRKHTRPGCRILFYGDSGTGKTLAATLLGKHLNKDVYRVDVSAVSSKYIGETSKRLDSLFNTAENKDWILFFDEGDALLGQRQSAGGDNNNSHYANQDTAFLLQRIESYNGIIIVATNFKNNIDGAFTRRFQSMVRFQLPDESIQFQLWMETLPKQVQLADNIDLMTLIKRHPLSQAAIINVIIRVCVLALSKQTSIISSEDLLMCIRDEEMKYMGRSPMGM